MIIWNIYQVNPCLFSLHAKYLYFFNGKHNIYKCHLCTNYKSTRTPKTMYGNLKVNQKYHKTLVTQSFKFIKSTYLF